MVVFYLVIWHLQSLRVASYVEPTDDGFVVISKVLLYSAVLIDNTVLSLQGSEFCIHTQ